MISGLKTSEIAAENLDLPEINDILKHFIIEKFLNCNINSQYYWFLIKKKSYILYV